MVNFIVDLSFNVEVESSEEALMLAKEKIRDMDFVNDNLTVKGDGVELLTLKGFVISSMYREKVLEHLRSVDVNGDTPTGISNNTGMGANNVSKILKDLNNKGLIVCINPEAKKGRIYRLTSTGEKVLDII